jgi:hypothetical protein
MNRTAFIYYTHYVSEVVLREIRRFSAELPADYDLWVIGRSDAPDLFAQVEIPRAATSVYSWEDLQTLPYPGKLADLFSKPRLFSDDLALMRFFRDHPDYARYWVCEYDVRYTGSWTALLNELDTSDADLLCAHLALYTEVPGWAHWAMLQRPGDPIPDATKLRGFMPFCRLSRRLFSKINDHYTEGLRGHCEAAWPTVANLEGFLVEEIGGGSRFAPPDRAKRFYFSSYFSNELFLSTFAPWPVYDESSRMEVHVRDILWHPVKEAIPSPSPRQIAKAPIATEPGDLTQNRALFLSAQAGGSPT